MWGYIEGGRAEGCKRSRIGSNKVFSSKSENVTAAGNWAWGMGTVGLLEMVKKATGTVAATGLVKVSVGNAAVMDRYGGLEGSRNRWYHSCFVGTHKPR